MSFLAIEVVKEFLFPHRPQNAIPALDGPWAPNDRLDQCGVLLDGLDQPDDLAMDDVGNLYLSTGCCVQRLVAPDYRDGEVIAEFAGRTGGLSWDPDAGLIVCVDGEGVAVIGGRYDGLTIKSVGGSGILSPTSTVVLSSGTVLLTEGSRRHRCDDWVWDLMEKGASGRLIELKLETGQASVLLDGLQYPAGLATVTDSDDSVLMTESWSHSVSVVELGSGGARQRRVLSNLAGYPWRIAATATGYWLCFFALRTQLVEFVLGEDAFRREMMASVEPDFWIRPALRATGHCYEPLQGGGIKQLGIMKPWAPPRAYGLIVELNRDLEALQTLHSRFDGIRHGITGLARGRDSLFATSKGTSSVLQIKADQDETAEQ